VLPHQRSISSPNFDSNSPPKKIELNSWRFPWQLGVHLCSHLQVARNTIHPPPNIFSTHRPSIADDG
jgi:hypothetical protein